jgi:hypothetical protein
LVTLKLRGESNSDFEYQVKGADDQTASNLQQTMFRIVKQLTVLLVSSSYLAAKKAVITCLGSLVFSARDFDLLFTRVDIF